MDIETPEYESKLVRTWNINSGETVHIEVELDTQSQNEFKSGTYEIFSVDRCLLAGETPDVRIECRTKHENKTLVVTTQHDIEDGELKDISVVAKVKLNRGHDSHRFVPLGNVSTFLPKSLY